MLLLLLLICLNLSNSSLSNRNPPSGLGKSSITRVLLMAEGFKENNMACQKLVLRVRQGNLEQKERIASK